MKKVTKKEIAQIRALYPQFCQAEIAEQLGISRQQVHYHLSVAGVILPGKRAQRDPETGLFMTQQNRQDIEFRRQLNPLMTAWQSRSIRVRSSEKTVEAGNGNLPVIS